MINAATIRLSAIDATPKGDECPLVLIRWLDSRQPSSAWRYLSEVGEPAAVECATVGWLLKDTADVKVICQSVGDLGDPENAQASGVMTIPARCVVSIERLEEAVTSFSRPCGPVAASGPTPTGS